MCASYYYHTEGFPQYYDFVGGSFDVFFDLFHKGEGEYGDYFQHLLSYIREKGRENILFLTYEEIKEDVESVIKKVVEFLGGEFLLNYNKEGVLEKVLANSSISTMRKVINEVVSCYRSPGSTDFVRKGVIGDYKNLLSDEQERKLSEKFRKACEGTEAMEIWRKYNFLPPEST